MLEIILKNGKEINKLKFVTTYNPSPCDVCVFDKVNFCFPCSKNEKMLAIDIKENGHWIHAKEKEEKMEYKTIHMPYCNEIKTTFSEQLEKVKSEIKEVEQLENNPESSLARLIEESGDVLVAAFKLFHDTCVNSPTDPQDELNIIYKKNSARGY